MNRHLTCEQISDYLIGAAAPEYAQHARECAACRSEVARLESALSEFRGAVQQWTGDVCRTDFQTSVLMNTGAGAHLDRLLTPASLERPWYQSLFESIAGVIHPPELPPLELTSKPVDPSELKGLSGLYAGNETRAGLSSLAVHAAVIALLLFLGSLKPVQRAAKQMATLILPAQPIKPVEHKGGGGGARQPIVKKAELPKPVRQFVAPRVDTVQTKLEVPSSLLDVPTVDSSNIGAPAGLNAFNGTGSGGGIGNGKGGGIGNGTGNGFGNGSGGGSGGGAYRPGNGVTNPKAIYAPEPQYSEEARKAKWMGSVILSLVVDEKGNPVQIHVTKALGLGLDEKAIEAVSKWKFEPGKKDGKPVPVQAQIEVTFRLL
jgi:TonB family protein